SEIIGRKSQQQFFGLHNRSRRIVPEPKIARLGKWAHYNQRRPVGMDVIERRLSVVEGNEYCAPFAFAAVIVDRTFHYVVYYHTECDIAVGNLLQWAASDHCRVWRLHSARVIVWLINVDELRQRTRCNHSVEVRDELRSAALV